MGISLINKREIINEKIKQVLSDSTKLNGIVDLMEIYDDDRFFDNHLCLSEILKLLSCGLGLIFVKYIPEYYNKEKVKNDNINQIAVWFNELYKDYKTRLLEYIRHFSDDHFTTTYFNLIKSEVGKNIKIDVAFDTMNLFIKYIIQNKSFKKLKFESEYLKYKDIKWLVLKSIDVIYSKEIQKLYKNEECNYIYENTFILLKCCSSIVQVQEKTQNIYYLCNSKNEKLKNIQKIFSNAWLKFLQVKLEFNLLISVYDCLNINVIPYILNPRIFADFLLQSIEQSHILGLLSLNSLFIIMTKHNLECESYYCKLYKLINVAINFDEIYKNNKELNIWWNLDKNRQSGKYLFWNILQLSLTSEYIPAYMAASFCKRLSRLAITCSNIADIILCLITIGSILSYHDGIRFLMSRRKGEELLMDPYNMFEENMEMSNAMSSSLWELISLKSHYCPEVVETVESLCEDTENAWNWRKTHFKIPQTLSNISNSGLIQQMIFKSQHKENNVGSQFQDFDGDEKIAVNANLTFY